jgi:glycosyltransferase involved in cell wall biosynthesis
MRRYVRQDTFFRAIPSILERHPTVVFLCSAMKDQPVAEQWIRRLGIGHAVRLLPNLPPAGMGDVYRMATVTVSPSVHDGTPNTLLEAMASGCVPVAGNIEPIREWISDGSNGLLFDSTNPRSLADAVHRALSDEELRHNSKGHNLQLISERGSYMPNMARARAFYSEMIGRS